MSFLSQDESKQFPLCSRLPADLLLPIITKMESVSYVRARISSKKLDRFCEANRYRIQVECNFPSTIEFISAIYMEDANESKLLNGAFVVVNYDKSKYKSSLYIEMTKEKIPLLRNAISGFRFKKIWIRNNLLKEDSANYDADMAEQRNRDFNEAFDYFIEAVGKTMIRHVSEANVSIKQLEKCLKLWRPSEFEICDYQTDAVTQQNKWNLCLAKNIFSITGDIYRPLEGLFDFQEFILNKKVINLNIVDFTKSDICNFLRKLIAKWKVGTFDALCARFNFKFSSSINQKSLIEEFIFYCLEGPIRLESFVVWEVRGNIHIARKKTSYWLYPLDDLAYGKRRGLIKVEHNSRFDGDVTIALLDGLDYLEEDMQNRNLVKTINADNFVYLLEQVFRNGRVGDHPIWIIKMVEKTIEDNMKYLQEKYKFIRSFNRNNSIVHLFK